jgi:hypothetical protein
MERSPLQPLGFFAASMATPLAQLRYTDISTVCGLCRPEH